MLQNGLGILFINSKSNKIILTQFSLDFFNHYLCKYLRYDEKGICPNFISKQRFFRSSMFYNIFYIQFDVRPEQFVIPAFF